MIYIDGLGYVNEDVSSVTSSLKNSSDATSGISTNSFQTVLDSVTNPLQSPASLEDYFSNAADKYGIDSNLLKAVAKQESNFQTDVTSNAGASGVMQLMPSTAASLGVTDTSDPEENIMGGAKLLSQLLKKYNGDLSLTLAAYNAGSGAVDKYNGVPPYTETKNYVDKVIHYYDTAANATSTGTTTKESEVNTTNISNDSSQVNNTNLTDSVSSLLKEYLLNHTTGTSSSEDGYTYQDYLRFVDEYINIISTFGDPIGESNSNSSTQESSSLDEGFDLSALYNSLSSSVPSNSSVLSLLQSTLAQTQDN